MTTSPAAVYNRLHAIDRTGMRTVYGSTPPLDGMKHEGGKKKFGKFRKSGNFKKKFGPRPPRKPRSE